MQHQKEKNAPPAKNLPLVLFVWFDSLRPSQQCSVMSVRVYLGWIRSKQGLILAYGIDKQKALKRDSNYMYIYWYVVLEKRVSGVYLHLL